MKYARDHTRNAKKFLKGTHFIGTVHSARFLHQRGVLEPDGSPEDAAITGPKSRVHAWHGTDSQQVDVSEPTEVGDPQPAGETEE